MLIQTRFSESEESRELDLRSPKNKPFLKKLKTVHGKRACG